MEILRFRERVNRHSQIADTRLDHYFLLGGAGQLGGILSRTPASAQKIARHFRRFKRFAVESRHAKAFSGKSS
jgi:hypothetical protein